MYIKYTYEVPDDRPIKKAEFNSSQDGSCEIALRTDAILEIVFSDGGHNKKTRVFTKSDFADFTALVNRINKQIGNE